VAEAGSVLDVTGCMIPASGGLVVEGAALLPGRVVTGADRLAGEEWVVVLDFIASFTAVAMAGWLAIPGGMTCVETGVWEG
jgi:hypothetical protein